MWGEGSVTNGPPLKVPDNSLTLEGLLAVKAKMAALDLAPKQIILSPAQYDLLMKNMAPAASLPAPNLPTKIFGVDVVIGVPGVDFTVAYAFPDTDDPVVSTGTVEKPLGEGRRIRRRRNKSKRRCALARSIELAELEMEGIPLGERRA